MKLDEAIELLEEGLSDCNKEEIPQFVAALKLGIEALKRYKVIRANFGKLRQDKLPGETEE